MPTAKPKFLKSITVHFEDNTARDRFAGWIDERAQIAGWTDPTDRKVQGRINDRQVEIMATSRETKRQVRFVIEYNCRRMVKRIAGGYRFEEPFWMRR